MTALSILQAIIYKIIEEFIDRKLFIGRMLKCYNSANNPAS